MNPLEKRKKELILACDINRQALQLELNLFEYRLAQLKSGYQKLPGLWLLAIPLAGLFLTRKLKHTTGALARGSVGLVAAVKLWKVLRMFFGPGSKAV